MGTGYSEAPKPSGALATRVTDSGTRMLSALLLTKAIPRRIHIEPSVMMKGCTRRPTTMAPFIKPASSPMVTATPNPSITVPTALCGSTARITMAIATPASA